MDSESGKSSPEKEFEAIQAIHRVLDPLDPDGRKRVVNYIKSLFSLEAQNADAERFAGPTEANTGQGLSSDAFGSLPELYDAANPVTNADKALVVSVWIQELLGQESFSSQVVNTELKHLGHGVANITNALDQLKDVKPALIHQLRKSGSSQQARKTYKVTLAGVRAVKTMTERSENKG